MSRVVTATHDRLRVTPQAATWAVLVVALLAVLAAWACSSRETFVVSHAKARDIVALFGDAWREPTGEFRITGGRMDGGIARILLAAPGRRASMTLEHVRARAPVVPGAVVVEQPGSDIVVVVSCTPACDAPSIALLRSLAERLLAAHPDRLWVRAHGFAVGRQRVVALALTLAVYCAVALVGVVVLWRAQPFSRERLADAALVCAFSFAATVLLGEPSVANWYSNNLPVAGGILDADDRNGVAGFLLQAVVRAILPWTDRTLFGLNLVLHAASGGVFYVAFRALSIERGVALLALLLWTVLPLSVRIGWSDAQHVQVELLFALLLLIWLRAQDNRHWPERLLGPLLAALLPFVRLEALLLAPLPLLFGPLVGDRPRSRRLLDALVYGALLSMSAAAVFELFVRHYDMSVSGLAPGMGSMLSLLDHFRLFRQFLVVESGMPNWFPWPATLLLAVGAVVLAARQPTLLAAFCIPQLLLGRLFNAEGMVGARYFLPVLALLALVAAHGLAIMAEGLQRVLARHTDGRSATLAARAAAMLGALTVVPASMPLYRYEYTFQGEHRFLRQALAVLPADSLVLHLPAREDDQLRNDPDCCLDPPNSPLALAFPSVHFEAIPIRPDRPHLPAAVDSRTYYYEGALCRLAPTRASDARNPGLSRTLKDLCA